MTSPWVEHVRNYSYKHNISYKDAMQKARASYKPQKTGGSMKSLVKKARRTVKKVNHASHKVNQMIDQHGDLINDINPEFGEHLGKVRKTANRVQNISGRVQDVTGGKFSFKNATKKARKTVSKVKNTSKRVNHMIDQHGDLINDINPEFGEHLGKVRKAANKVENISSRVQDVTGGKFNLKKATRKARHTVGKVRKIAKAAAPILAVAAPEFGVPLEAAIQMTGGKLGSKNNPYVKNGGSFRAHGSGLSHSNCPTCGMTTGGSFGRAKSSVLSDTHNSFRPAPPRSYAHKIINN